MREGCKPMRICKICNNRLPENRSVYCSNKCSLKQARDNARKKYSKVEYVERICACCGKTFMPKKKQMYCSPSCVNIVRVDKRKQWLHKVSLKPRKIHITCREAIDSGFY